MLHIPKLMRGIKPPPTKSAPNPPKKLHPSADQLRLEKEQKKKDTAQLSTAALRTKQEEENEEKNSLDITEEDKNSYEEYIRLLEPKFDNLKESTCFSHFLRTNNYQSMADLYEDSSDETHRKHSATIEAIRIKLFDEATSERSKRLRRLQEALQPRPLSAVEKKIKEEKERAAAKKQEADKLMQQLKAEAKQKLALLLDSLNDLKENQESDAEFPWSVINSCYFGIIQNPPEPEKDIVLIHDLLSPVFFGTNNTTRMLLVKHQNDTLPSSRKQGTQDTKEQKDIATSVFAKNPLDILFSAKEKKINLSTSNKPKPFTTAALEEFSNGISQIIAFLKQIADKTLETLQTQLLRYPPLIQDKLIALQKLEAIRKQMNTLEAQLALNQSLETVEGIIKTLISELRPSVLKIINESSRYLSYEENSNAEILLNRISGIAHKAEITLNQIKKKSVADLPQQIKEDSALPPLQSITPPPTSLTEIAATSTLIDTTRLTIALPSRIIASDQKDLEVKAATIVFKEEAAKLVAAQEQKPQKNSNLSMPTTVAKEWDKKSIAIAALMILCIAALVAASIFFPPLGVITSISLAPTLSTVFAAIGAACSAAFFAIRILAAEWLAVLQEKWQDFCHKHSGWAMAFSIIGMLVGVASMLFGAISLLSFTSAAALFQAADVLTTAMLGGGWLVIGVSITIKSAEGFTASLSDSPPSKAILPIAPPPLPSLDNAHIPQPAPSFSKPPLTTSNNEEPHIQRMSQNRVG